MARAGRLGPERRGESLPGTGIPALGHTHQMTESEYISTERSRRKANIMTAQATTPRSTTATVLRAWIIAGLGALILLVVFMLHASPASASQAAAAARPCATSAVPCHKCSHCQKCVKCQKCTKGPGRFHDWQRSGSWHQPVR